MNSALNQYNQTRTTIYCSMDPSRDNIAAMVELAPKLLKEYKGYSVSPGAGADSEHAGGAVEPALRFEIISNWPVNEATVKLIRDAFHQKEVLVVSERVYATLI